MLRELSIFLIGHDLGKYRPGIGPNSFGYLRIIVPYQGLFFDAGVKHDLDYCLGGLEKDKELADYLFYTGCKLKCKNNLQLLFAYLYYKAVKNYGRFYFNYH